MSARYIVAASALDFIDTLQDGSVNLLLMDPPYGDIVDESWDKSWKSARMYGNWLAGITVAMRPKMHPKGSMVFFGAIGRHGHRPMWRAMMAIEELGQYHARNYITWGKRRAYGKSHDYLFCREEIAWYSVAPGRTDVTFNIPLTNQLRGYAGFNAKYPAKSEYKRVTNVWTDIPELFKTEIQAQKPLPLIDRLVNTHSNAGDLVVDLFCGSGTTGISALSNERRFSGCEIKPDLAKAANLRCEREMMKW